MTPAQRSNAMKRVRLQNGSLELRMQKALAARGLRFTRHSTELPGKPDIVFRAANVAVFVDGDFWHGWRLPSWEHKLSPFWRDKLRANRARDTRNFRRLRSRGWRVIRIWQHDIVRNLPRCVDRIERTIREAVKLKERASCRRAVRLTATLQRNPGRRHRL